MAYNSCVVSETLVHRIRTFGRGNRSARGIGVCAILGREETREIDKTVVSALESSPGRGRVVTNCCMGLVAGGSSM